jgi:hypothetical protein
MGPFDPSQRMEAALSFDTSIIAQDYINVFELFDVVRAAATVEHLGYQTWLDGTVRTLHTDPGPQATRIIQRYDASGRPYPVGDDQPHGWAAVTLTTENLDSARRRHDCFLDELGQWLATQGVRWCWRHNDDLWVVGNAALRR